MPKQIINTAAAPAAIGPYSQAVAAGDFLFLSGQIPLDPLTGQLCANDISRQVEQVLNNIKAILASAGLDFSDIVKTVIYLTDLADFAIVNEAYAQSIPEPFPARTTIQVAALPRGARIEIEATAKRH